MTTGTATRTTSIDRWIHPAALYLVSIDSLKNRYRFYLMRHQRTLWGEDVLVQAWGRQGTDGRTRVRFLEGREDVQTAMAKLLRRRLQHGYQVVAVAGITSSETRPALACALPASPSGL